MDILNIDNVEITKCWYFVRLKELDPKKYDYLMRGGQFDESGMWIPGPDENGKIGLGYKFIIDWLNEHGNLGIKY